MRKYFLYIGVLAAAILGTGMLIRFGLKGAIRWDIFINNKVKSRFSGFRWFYRLPLRIGTIFEYFFYLICGKKNYFKNIWWPLRTSAVLASLVFFAAVFRYSTVEAYYQGYWPLNFQDLITHVNGGFTFWYLNSVHILFIGMIGALIVESIRMHHWVAPVRIVFYTILSLMMAGIVLMAMTFLLSTSLFYLIYRFIRRIIFPDADIVASSYTRNPLIRSFRRFREELLEWDAIRKLNGDLRTMQLTEHPELVAAIDEPAELPKKKQIDQSIPRVYPD